MSRVVMFELSPVCRLSISKTMRKDLGWAKEKTEIVFGSQPDNSAWEGPVVSWVCASWPKSGTVTFDCVPEVRALKSDKCH